MPSVKVIFFYLFLFIGTSVVFNSCRQPETKDDYLANFKSFVERVERHHEDYSKKDWMWADKRFELYNNDWYDKFEDELTTEEKLEVITLKLEYSNLKDPNAISNLLKNLRNEDVEGIKKKVDDYVENDLDEDVEKLMDGMKEIGDSAVKVLEDVFEEIDNQF